MSVKMARGIDVDVEMMLFERSSGRTLGTKGKARAAVNAEMVRWNAIFGNVVFLIFK
jgi:hypothetical protein